MNRNIRITSAITIALFILFAGACRKKSTTVDITGCTDPVATNYDSTATVNSGCHYAVDDVAGNYLMTDTVITFHHNLTTGWYDTTVENYTLHVIAYGHDSMDFNDRICLQCHRGAVGYFSISKDFTHYSWAYDMGYYDVSGSGTFNGGLFTHSEGHLSMDDGSNISHGTGHRQ